MAGMTVRKGGGKHVRAVYRSSATGGRAGARRSQEAQSQLHRHRAHPTGPDPGGRGRGQQAPSGHIPFTPRAKKVLELSLREAKALGHNYIGTEHILLGLIREGSGVAAQVLVKLGADLNRARQQVVELLHGYHGEDVTGEGPPLPDDALTRVDSLDRRLAVIERWVGLRADLDDLDQEIGRVRREKEAAIDRQDFEASVGLRDQEKQLLAARAGRDAEWAEAAAGRVPLAQELGRVKAELERLRGVLREHGIEPGDDAT
jgi:ATP-dependent Clp protease ATP-binding subunit ClpA